MKLLLEALAHPVEVSDAGPVEQRPSARGDHRVGTAAVLLAALAPEQPLALEAVHHGGATIEERMMLTMRASRPLELGDTPQEQTAGR